MANGSDPVSFVYEDSSFPNAEYSIYAAEDIISQDKKTLIHKKDTLYRKQQNIISLTYAGQTTTLALAETEYSNKRPEVKVFSFNSAAFIFVAALSFDEYSSVLTI